MRKRAAPSGAAETLDDDEDAEDGSTHRFDVTLSWTAGKALSTAELLKRLERLAENFKATQQEDITEDKSELSKPAKQLVHANLLRHKDKGVKSWTACCLVHVLRLAAPDAPFSSAQLKDIFTLFISHSIASLADPADAYHTQNYFVLQELASTSAIVLLSDLPSPNSLIITLFDTCFDILGHASEELNRNIEFNLTNMLQQLVGEKDTLPTEAVDITLAQFMHADPGLAQHFLVKGRKGASKEISDPSQPKLQLRKLPAAYRAAQSVCNECEDRMASHIGQYFSNVILGASGAVLRGSKTKSRHRGQSEDDEDDDTKANEPSKEDVEQLGKAHKLLRELWKSCPGVLQGVIPQIEAELSADNLDLRRLATEALGDMVSGIGVEADLVPPTLDATLLFLSKSADTNGALSDERNAARAPKATQSFVQAHPSAYQNFLSRRNDKAAEVRAIWATSIGRILSTSAGGVGLSPQEQSELFDYLSDKLTDPDEKVRIAAVHAFTLLNTRDFQSLFSSGRSAGGSRIAVLTGKVKDVSSTVRSVATKFLGKLWAAAEHEISTQNDEAIEVFGSIPSHILNGAYLNRPDMNALIEQVIFESLVPLGYPIMKKKGKNGIPNGATEDMSDDTANMFRAQRILLLHKHLDERAKKALAAILGRPSTLAKYVRSFLDACDKYNGGVVDGDEQAVKTTLRGCIDMFCKMMPDSTRANEDLWRFAKLNDRRSYALIRFCIADDSDYKKIFRSIKELTKRLEGSASSSATLKDTMLALLYKVSHLFYNKSHVKPIMDISGAEGPLAPAAQELLKDISNVAPGIFKAHGKELCELVESNAPTHTRTNHPSTVDALKACASFARRYPKDVPKEKGFVQAMMRYIARGSPPSTAKYAISIILLSSEKKELHTKEILKQCLKDFEFGKGEFLTQLAGLSQLMLLRAHDMDEEKDIDPVLQIAIKGILARPVPSGVDPESSQGIEEIESRCWALKILVNRLRAYPTAESIKDICEPVYQLLNKHVASLVEVSSANKTLAQVVRSRLCVQAALLHLKLSTHSDFDSLLKPRAFNGLVLVAQCGLPGPRGAFVKKVKKYLGQDRLPSRYYIACFLLAFEPSRAILDSTKLWLRSRAAILSQRNKATLELCLSRFLSVLAHHPDTSRDMDDLQGLVEYIVFYLQNVATSTNISLIYYIAQRVKTVQDGIDATKSDILYYLSELACAVINAYATVQNWSVEAFPGKDKIGMPSGVFVRMKDHRQAQDVADQQYLPEEAADMVEGFVRAKLKASKKRKSESEEDRDAKRRALAKDKPADGGNDDGERVKKPSRSTQSKKQDIVKTPKKVSKRNARNPGDDFEMPSSGSVARRTSSRAKGQKSYVEISDEDEDVDIEAHDQGISPRSDKENVTAR